MTEEIEKLMAQLTALEERIERKIDVQQEALSYRLQEGKAVFEREVAERHRELKMSIATFLRNSPIPTLVSAPVIYAMIVPIAFLDISVTV